MGLCQVTDVDIISNAGSIRGGIVGTKDIKPLELSLGRLYRPDDQMSRLRISKTDLSLRIGSSYIEIPERRILGPDQIYQDHTGSSPQWP